MSTRLRAALMTALLLSAATGHSAAAGPDRPVAGPVTLLGSGPHQLDLGLGVFGLRHNAGRDTQAARLELRIGRKFAYLGPAAGLLANRDGIRYAYGGIYADFAVGKFVVTPVLAAGIFRKGANADLGGPLEFRESLEIAYRVSGRWRLGVSVAHVSNAEIYQNNPGQEDLLLTCAVGF